MLNFPPSPAINDVFTANGKTWVWNGVMWAATAVVGPTGDTRRRVYHLEIRNPDAGFPEVQLQTQDRINLLSGERARGSRGHRAFIETLESMMGV